MAVVSITPVIPSGVSVSARGVRGPAGPALEMRLAEGVIEWRVAGQTPEDDWKSLIDLESYMDGIESAQQASEDARDLAQKWASENKDVVVEGGLYSALHHAAKAAASAGSANDDAGVASGAKTDAETARDLAKDWAEKPDGQNVDGVGTRSAKHHAGVATGAASTATTKAGEASESAGDAADARDKAQDWAEKAEDAAVEAGQYSAKHHAAKAAASALAAATFNPSSYTPTDELAAVALSGDYGDLDGKPTLGDAAEKNTGTTAGTVAAGDDGRFTDSREWTADTVTQEDAEAGTATDRKAWTAQRVAQAIAALAGGGGGYPANVVVTTKTDTASRTSMTFADVSGLSVTITPSSASSRILLVAALSIGSQTNTTQARFKMLRGSTDILVGAADGSRTRVQAASNSPGANYTSSIALLAVDAPGTTSPVTYNTAWASSSDTNAVYINRSHGDTDAAISERGASILVAMEIGAAP